MKEKLLSIVVPTKNRPECLMSLIQLIVSFNYDDIELVIQDNSDDNHEIARFLKGISNHNIIYEYDNTPMPVIMNSELAIKNSNGRFVCFIGDDDLLSKYLYQFVQYMDQYGYESAIFQKAKYSWPSVSFKVHNFPNLIIPKYAQRLERVDVGEEYNNLLKYGGVSLEKMPQLYQGVVRRDKLDEIYNLAGTYFPGPSPDMAVAVALTKFVKQHIICDIPYITSGVSAKSTAGLGAKHMHKGNLRDMKFLPIDIEERWNRSIPKIWTGPTIYAESAIEAIKAIGQEYDLSQFNYNYFFAWFRIFCSEYKTMLAESKKITDNYNPIEYWLNVCKVLVIRTRKYVENKMLLKLHSGAILQDNLNDSYEAGKFIDEYLEKIDLGKMFFEIQ